MFRVPRLRKEREQTAKAEQALERAEARSQEVAEVVIEVRDVIAHNHLSARVRQALLGRHAS